MTGWKHPAPAASAATGNAMPSSRLASSGARVPATLTLVAVILIVGLVGQGLWSPTSEQLWYEAVANGLPALQAGKWWTPLTGTFFVVSPWVYIPTLLCFVGVGLLEWRRGTRIAMAYFWGGQLVGILASALFLFLASMLPWPWAVSVAGDIDVGASAGGMACVAACVGLLASPWRQRLWLAVFAYGAIGVLFIGTLADLEHAAAIILVFAIDRSLRIQLASVRERRLLAFVASIGLGIIRILTLLIPTDGPFGPTAPLESPWFGVVLDSVVIVLVSNRLRRGRRWAWILTVVWAVLNVVLAAAVILSALLNLADADLSDGDTDPGIATSVLWLAFLVYLIAARQAFRSRRRHPLDHGRGDGGSATAEEARAVIKTHGGGTLSWMSTCEGMQYFRTSTGLVGSPGGSRAVVWIG